MKYYFTITCSLFFYIALSQVVITDDDMPGAGDTLRYSDTFTDTLTVANLLLSGDDVTWDFSHLRPIRQGIKEYERALFTPYALFFLGFNQYGAKEFDSIGFGAFQFEDIYQFYRRNRNDFRAEGIGIRFRGIPIPAYFTDEDELYQFPLAYSNEDISTYSFQMGLEEFGLVYESTGERENNVDAWGEIITPYGTFECIRVVSQVSSMDSVKVSDFAIGLLNNRVEYKWLAKEVKMPVLEISGREVGERFIPTRIRYRDTYRNPATFVEQLAPTVDFVANNLTPNLQDTVTFTSNSSELTVHDWQFNPPTVTYVNGTNRNSRDPQVSFDALGKYDVTLSVSNTIGTSDTTRFEYVEVKDIASSAEIINKYNFFIFPNPTADWLSIQYEQPTATKSTIELFNSKGQLITSVFETTNSGEQAININLQNYLQQHGTYWLRLKIGKEIIWEKVIF